MLSPKENLKTDACRKQQFQKNAFHFLASRNSCILCETSCAFITVVSLYFSYVVNPLITTNPMSQQITDGQIVIFTCNAIAFPAPLYSWSTPSGSTIFNTSVIGFTASYFDFGNYTCMATSNGITVESQPALLTGNYVM